MSTVLLLVLLSVGGSTVLWVFGGLLVRRTPHRFNDAVLATAGGAISRQRERSMSSIRTSRSFGLTKWETRFPWVMRLKEGPNEIRHHRWCGGGGGHQKEGGLIMRWLLLDAFIVIGSVGLQLEGTSP